MPDEGAGEQIADQVAADLATLDAAEAQFAAVDHALRRLDDGSYWTCESCGGDIGAVVEGEPLRRRCAACGPRPSAGGDDTGDGAVPTGTGEGER